MTHELKVWREYYQEVELGIKNFEVRKNDRDFKVGDTLILKCYDNMLDIYLGRSTVRRVTYILDGCQFGIEKGYVVLGLNY